MGSRYCLHLGICLENSSMVKTKKKRRVCMAWLSEPLTSSYIPLMIVTMMSPSLVKWLLSKRWSECATRNLHLPWNNDYDRMLRANNIDNFLFKGLALLVYIQVAADQKELLNVCPQWSNLWKVKENFSDRGWVDSLIWNLYLHHNNDMIGFPWAHTLREAFWFAKTTT